MRVSSSIEDPSVIRATLKHLGLWLTRARPPPKAQAPPGGHDGVVSPYADDDLQLQTHADTIYGDPEYTWEEYIQS
jgi:hypothetical protein